MKALPAQDSIEDAYADVPDAMRAARRWLVWKSVPQAGKKPRKVPYYVNGQRREGPLDATGDVSQLAGFDDAVGALSSGGYAGLGFALGPDGTGAYWQGIDLDDLHAHPGLEFVADDLPGYIEASPSGRGLHAIGYGRRFAALGSNATGIEAYCEGRFFTVTGEKAGRNEPTCLAGFVEQRLALLHGRVEGEPEQEEPVQLLTSDVLRDLRSALASLKADDRELWVRMGHALKHAGEQGRGLWFEWSQTSLAKYDPEDAARVWASLKPSATDHRAVFAEAQRHGWLNPRKALARSLNAAPGDVPKIIGALEFMGRRTPIRYVWQRVLQEGCLYALTAPPGGAKTAIALTVALHVATGRPLYGRPTVRSKVLYLAAENPADVEYRLSAACACLGLDPQELSGWLHMTEKPWAIDDPTQLEAFVAKNAEAGPFQLCVIDTGPSHSATEDENSNREQHVLAVAMRDLMGPFGSPATVALMHPNKGATRDTLAPRGGSAFSGNIDGELAAWKDDSVVEFFHRAKFRGPGFPPMFFELHRHEFDDVTDNFGEPVVAIVAVPTDRRPKPKAALTTSHRIALQTLADCHAEAVPILSARPDGAGPSRAVPEDIWRERAYAAGISGGGQTAKRAAFGRSRSALLTLGLIGAHADHYWLTAWGEPDNLQT